MTVIVASLFLPYSVEFKIDQQVSKDLIKDLTVEKKQILLSSSQLPSHTSNSILSRSHVNLPNTGDYHTNNSSVEDFFLNGSTLGSPKPAGDTTRTNDSTSFHNELSNRLLSLNRSSSSSSSSFVPKTTVKNTVMKKSVNESDVNLSKVQKTLKKQSNLKYEQVIHYDGDDDGAYSGLSSDVASDSEDDRYDNLYSHKVPKFGGFSRKNILNNTTDETSEVIFKDFSIVPYSKGNGALKTAVKSAVVDHKWLGTIGIPTDRLPDVTKVAISQKLSKLYKCESVLPSDSTFQGHYKNFCKQILWPTLHYQIPDNPNSKAFEDHSWEFYKKLNQDFAEKLIEIYKDGDIIWIHDYHLFLLPQMIRERLPNAKIGFFLHVSFPSSELFKCFAQREYLLKGILGANFIGFQTDEYCRHFGQTCNKLLLADISKNEIRYNGSVTHIAASPVGIDARALSEQFHSSEGIHAWRTMIRERWPRDIKLIVGRDKFDRIRGVKQKLLAYELFLKNNPQHIENSTLIQICLTSSTHKDVKMESEIMSIVDRINSLAPNISSSFQPVVLLHQDIEFVQYLALIAEADCFIVSSMREGMNLTCHEFIVATEFKKSPLIISEFTGSASVFGDEDVFKINPWDIKQFSQAIKSALELPQQTKEKHWENLINVVKNQDCYNWVESNLEGIQETWKFENDKRQMNYEPFNFSKFYKAYKECTMDSKKLFILNLSNIIPSERMLKVLNGLALIPNNQVYVFSNFKKNEAERIYRTLLPRIGLIAENGGLVKLANNNKSWISLVNIAHFKKWFKDSKKLFTSFEERLPGSFYEVGETFVKFHTKSCRDRSKIDPERMSSLIGDLISHINDFEHEENDSVLIGRSDSVASTYTSTTTSTTNTSIGLNTVEVDELKMHATLNDDEVIYIEQMGVSLKVINFLVKYYTNHEIQDLVDHSQQLSATNDTIDVGEYSGMFIPATSPIDAPQTPFTINGPQTGLNPVYGPNVNKANGSVELMTVAGNRDIFFDSIYDYLNERTDDLKREDNVENIFTIGYDIGVGNRGARENVEGLNKLLSLLSQLT